MSQIAPENMQSPSLVQPFMYEFCRDFGRDEKGKMILITQFFMIQVFLECICTVQRNGLDPKP